MTFAAASLAILDGSALAVHYLGWVSSACAETRPVSFLMCSTISVRRIARSSLCDSAGELHLLVPRTPKSASPRRPGQQLSQTLEARQPVVRCSATRESTGQRLASWDNLTQRLVTLSSLPFLFLLLPQLLKNAASLSSNPEALGILVGGDLFMTLLHAQQAGACPPGA